MFTPGTCSRWRHAIPTSSCVCGCSGFWTRPGEFQAESGVALTHHGDLMMRIWIYMDLSNLVLFFLEVIELYE